MILWMFLPVSSINMQNSAKLEGLPVLLLLLSLPFTLPVLTLPGEGLPLHNVPSEFGALRVTLRIAFPKALTAAERAFVAANFQDDSGGVG